MEGAEKFVPSRIWPQTFDDDLIDLGKPLYLFQDLALGVQEVGLCPPNREIGVSQFREAVACGERTGE